MMWCINLLRAMKYSTPLRNSWVCAIHSEEAVAKPVSVPVEVNTEAVAALPRELLESLSDAAHSLSQRGL